MVTYLTNLFIASIAASIFLLIFLVMKTLFGKNLSSGRQYNISILAMMSLVIPLMPIKWSTFNWGWFPDIKEPLDSAVGAPTVYGTNGASDFSSNLFKDFSVSMERAIPDIFWRIILCLWAIGGAVVLITVVLDVLRLRKLKKGAILVSNPLVLAAFEQCKVDVAMKRNVRLFMLEGLNTPIAAGVLRESIIMPTESLKTLTEQEICHVFLHELIHCKKRDILIRYGSCFLKLIYWYNPIVHVFLNRMSTEREMACDAAVLKRLPDECCIEYGQTILTFAAGLSPSIQSGLAVDMGGAGKQIYQRIKAISEFQGKKHLARWTRWKGALIFSLTGFLIFAQIPAISALTNTSNSTYDFRAENVLIKDYSADFGKVDGSFVLYDMQKDRYVIHNEEGSKERVSPDSTYKIFCALAALENGVISDDDNEVEWDGKPNPYKTWDKDQNLSSALHTSVNWYFQYLDRRVGKQKLQDFYRQIGYGNYDLSGDLSSYWADSSLKISAIEQVLLLKALYDGSLPVSQKNSQLVKDTLYLTQQDGASLSGKTGTGQVNHHMVNGWFVGFIEKGGCTYIFATNIHGEDGASGEAAVRITQKILTRLI